MVEFALVAPILLVMIAGSVDIGRGVLLYALLAGASRDTARQALLVANSGSNTLPPSCTTLAKPCKLQPVIQSAHLLDSLGVKFSYADSLAINAPPPYGVLAPNTVYVFIYELDSGGGPSPRYSCRTPACIAANGLAVRTQGHQLVVVDLKLRWQPVLARLLGIPAAITFDSQAVERIEF